MKEKIFTIILVSMVCFALPFSPARAGTWGESIAGQLLNLSVTEIRDIIKGAIMSALKQAAVEALEENIGSIVGGSSSDGAKFITNWEDALYGEPQEKAKEYMNDFFTLTTRGKCSGNNYSSSEISGDYVSQLCEIAKQASTEATKPYTNIEEYADNPSDIFAEGNWKGFSAMISNPANNSIGMTIMAQGEYQERLKMEEEKARTRAQASQGFKDTESNGMTTLPGSITKEILAKAETASIDLISNAQSPGEVLANVILSVVTRTLRQGIGDVSNSIQTEITNTIDSVETEIVSGISL